jgi:hypothetical protein
MNAPPCPSVAEMKRDPNVCAICGHWCGKKCERPLEWNPRFVAYCVLEHGTRDFDGVLLQLRERAPGGQMSPFISWVRAQVHEWQRTRAFGGPLDHAAFDEWLRRKMEMGS